MYLSHQSALGCLSLNAQSTVAPPQPLLPALLHQPSTARVLLGKWGVLLGVFPLQPAGDRGGTSYLSSSPLSVSSTFCRLLPLSRANSLTSEPSTRRLRPSCPSSTARHSSPSLLP